MRDLLTVVLTAATLAAADAPVIAQASAGNAESVAPHSDRAFAELEGAWVVDKALSGGKTVPKDKIVHEWHFKRPGRLVRKGITVGRVTGRDREDAVTLDSSQKPAAMNMKRPGEAQTVLAIYKVEGDWLTICLLRAERGPPSAQRPTTFASDEGTRSDLLVLKRKPKASK